MDKKKLEALADVLILLGAALIIVMCARISATLAIGVAGGITLTAGILLTFFAMRGPKRPPGEVDRGPFERDA